MYTLSTLRVTDLILTGVHGSTGREPHDPQRFRLDIAIHLDTERAEQTDNIHDTYDYKDAVQIARQVIEQEHHVLIEKIAARILERVCHHPAITSVDIKIEKINAGRNGVPSIVISRTRNPQEMRESLCIAGHYTT